MKVVIISQNCFPYISPRSTRATELAKEFARQGNQVILYALTGGLDYSEFTSQYGVVVKNIGTSRYGLFDNTQNRRWNKLNKGLAYFIGRYINFPKCEMAKLTYDALKSESNIDTLVTIAVPHSIHWGAARFRENHPEAIKNWIADCGDPFMLNPHAHFPWYFEYVEKKWCRLCDFITIPIEEARNAYFPEFSDKIRVVPQGFDFVNNQLAKYKRNEVPTFGFAGLFYEKLRDPHAFFDYLCTIETEFKFILYIKDTPYYRSAFHLNNYQQKLGIRLEIHNFVPREKLLYELSKMDFLINIRNSSGVQQPSKLIDYAIAGRPILEITSDFNERSSFAEFMVGDYHNQTKIRDIDRFDIRNVVKQMTLLVK